MKIPTLDKSNRAREFESYSNFQKSAVIKGWLFEGLSHRELDFRILGLDPVYSKGYQSMGILHFLGLKREFSGLFRKHDKNQTIALLEADNQDFSQIINFLENTESEEIISLHELSRQEEEKVEAALKDSRSKRLARIKNSNKEPTRIKVYSYTYERNPDIVVESLFRANGYCEKCGCKAPFSRLRDNSPYLEVHHIEPLSKGGKDDLDNVLALCPNCHRETHYG